MYRRYERQQVRARAWTAVIGMFIIAILLIGASKLEQREYTEQTVIVRTDTDTRTLWNIAAAYGPNDMDINEYIDIIKKDNGLDSNTIYPGDVLTIRIYEEK